MDDNRDDMTNCQVCKYNVPFGKQTRGLLVVETFMSLANSSLTTDDILANEETLDKARVLGWCVEWMQVRFSR
jgi:hypothetical protein